MKDKGNIVFKLLAHASIILSGMFLTFFVIDRVNPYMEFLTSEMSAWLILAFAIISLTQSILIIVMLRRHEKRQLTHTERVQARAELEKTLAEADKEFMESLLSDINKKREDEK